MAKSRRIGSAYLDLSVRSKQFRTDLASAERRTKRTAGAFRRASSGMSRLATSGLGAAAGAGAAGLAFAGLAGAVIGAGKAAVDSVRAFAATEAALSKVVGLVGVSRQEVTRWHAELNSLAGEVGKGPRELADALFYATSAGLRGAAAMAAVRESARAASGGLGQTADVMRAVTAVMNSWGASAAEATDTLVATVREGSLEASELASSVGQVTAIAAKMGVEFREVGAWIANFTRGGLSASESITQLRAVIKTFAKPSSEAERTMAELGVSAADLRDVIRERGLYAAVTELTTAIGDQDDALVKIFGEVEAFAGVLSVTGDAAEQMETILRSMGDTTGSTEAAFGAFADTLQGKWALVRSSFAGIREAIGGEIAEEIVLPALTGLQGWLDDNRDIILAGVRDWENVFSAFGLTVQMIMEAVFSGSTFVALGRGAMHGLIEGVHQELQKSLPGSALSWILQAFSGQGFVGAFKDVVLRRPPEDGPAPFGHVTNAFQNAGKVWEGLAASWEASAAEAAATEQAAADEAAAAQAAAAAAAAAAQTQAAEAAAATTVEAADTSARLTDAASKKWYAGFDRRRASIEHPAQFLVERGPSPFQAEFAAWRAETEAMMREWLDAILAVRVAAETGALGAGEADRLEAELVAERDRAVAAAVAARPQPRLPQAPPAHLLHVDPTGREQMAQLRMAYEAGALAIGEVTRFAAALTPGAIEGRLAAWWDRELRARAVEEDRQRVPESPAVQIVRGGVQAATAPLPGAAAAFSSLMGSAPTQVLAALGSRTADLFEEVRAQIAEADLAGELERAMTEAAEQIETAHIGAALQQWTEDVRRWDVAGLFDPFLQAIGRGTARWKKKITEANPMKFIAPVIEQFGGAIASMTETLGEIDFGGWFAELLQPAGDALAAGIDPILDLILGRVDETGSRDFGTSAIGGMAGPMQGMGTAVGGLGMLAGVDTSSGISSFLGTVESVGSSLDILGIKAADGAGEMGFAASALGALGPAAAALGPVLQGMMSVLKPLILDALKPLLGILRVIGKFLGGILAPSFHILGAVTKLVGQVFQWLYNNVFKHVGNVIIQVYNAIADVINFLLGWLGINIAKAALLEDIDIEQEGAEALDAVGGSSSTGSAATFRQQRPIEITVNIHDNEIAGDGSFRDLAIRLRDELETLGALNA